jgi:hypothetical protein
MGYLRPAPRDCAPHNTNNNNNNNKELTINDGMENEKGAGMRTVISSSKK